MTHEQHYHLGPDTHPLEQIQSAHGRARIAYQAAPEGAPRAALALTLDPERLAFALAEGPAAERLAGHLAQVLWTAEALEGVWPDLLRDALEALRERDAPPGLTRFVCGRIERTGPGGQLALAWLGLDTLDLSATSGERVPLAEALEGDVGWDAERGVVPPDATLGAYRAALFGLDRLVVGSRGVAPLLADVPDLASADLQRALENWGAEAASDVVLLDVRLYPPAVAPGQLVLRYRWAAADQCVLYWDEVANATGYRVEEAAAPTCENPSLVAELTDPRQLQYSFSPPVGSPRYYRVVPLNQGVPGEPSAPLSPTPIALMPPLLEPVEWSSEGGYALHWTPVPQATSYEVQASPDLEFDEARSTIVYRGALAEAYVPRGPQRAYRVRSLNTLYAPDLPSPWSQLRRTPARLETPTFTQVSHKRLEWTPVAGARQYGVRVTARGQDEDQGADVFTLEPACSVANEPATYRVRAIRDPRDLSTVSEWSSAVVLAPAELPVPAGRDAGRWIGPLLLAAALVALLVGFGLGMIGLNVYLEANATATRTPLSQAALAATEAVLAQMADSATQVVLLRADFEQRQAAELTRTNLPSATIPPTPNVRDTAEALFAARLTATAEAWTATPQPTASPAPSRTPAPAPRPTLTATPDLAVTVAAYLQHGCTFLGAPARDLPLLAEAQPGADILLPAVPLLASVDERRVQPDGAGQAVWLRVSVPREGAPALAGWVRVPSDVRERSVYGGPECPP